jgi:poly-gamma-glutamate capsule biosynthesis protein CapA/YwtB (metallophosphatase superfamily)
MESLTLRLTGDLILDRPDPSAYFAPSLDALRAADLLIGQVEVPHTDRGHEESTDVPAPPSEPRHLDAWVEVGLGVATLAGNHIGDQGAEGVLDTIEHLRARGIATAGAGANLDEARALCVVERAGVRVGVLSYNCVGPAISWATAGKAGCAYVEILTHYDSPYAGPGGMPRRVYSFPETRSFARFAADVAAAREQVDVLCVALHKGLGHVPAQLAQYEQTVSYAAIDAGADVVIGHHAHILRGIEIYDNRPIFHGLGNYVTVTNALSDRSSDNDSPERRAWARERRRLAGFTPDPAMPEYPFHPESRNTMLGHVRWTRGGGVEAGFVPCWIDDAARPVPLGPGEGDGVVDYVRGITATAALGTAYAWGGDGVVWATAS